MTLRDSCRRFERFRSSLFCTGQSHLASFASSGRLLFVSKAIKKIIIIGAGIGGLTAAIALGQRGFNTDVYEAAPQLKPLGKGIWIPANAMQVFQRLGLSDEMLA